VTTPRMPPRDPGFSESGGVTLGPHVAAFDSLRPMCPRALVVVASLASLAILSCSNKSPRASQTSSLPGDTIAHQFSPTSASPRKQDPPAMPEPPAGVKLLRRSHYGQFRMHVGRREGAKAHEGPRCGVSFISESLETTPLFTEDDCTGAFDAPKVSEVGPTEQIGSVAFPFLSPGGDEFHVFEILAVRGGNALPGSEYWVVVVRKDKVWASSLGYLIRDLTQAKILAESLETPATLVLEEPPTTTAAGEQYTVNFGHISKLELPIIPSTVTSKHTRRVHGGLVLQARGAVLAPDDIHLLVDINDEGTCQLTPFYGSDVWLTIEETTWSDGRTAWKCLGVER
jgi:hypothetical protein